MTTGDSNGVTGAHEPSLARRVLLGISRTFLNGFIALLPIGAAIFVLSWLFDAFEKTFNKPIIFVLDQLFPDAHVYRYGMGFVLGLVLIFLLGLALNAYIFRELLATSERLLQRLPLAKTVMSSVRDVTGFFSKSEKKQLSQVVFVHLAHLPPWAGVTPAPTASASNTGAPGDVAGASVSATVKATVRLVGFLTRADLTDLPPGAALAGHVAVYFPFSYAVGGITALVPRDAIEPTTMSMEEAMRFCLTAGMKREAEEDAAK